MTIEAIESGFKEKVCKSIRLSDEGLQRYRVFTPFLFDDADHFCIVLKRRGEQWVLSDEGHTFMHLTYDIDEKDLQQGTRAKIIANTLAQFGVEDNEGELVMEICDEQYGNALYSFIQAIDKLASEKGFSYDSGG